MKEPPPPSWTRAQKSVDGRTQPQIIAHRGYRARYPENTLEAFRAAVAAGAQALETDVHLTRDGVAVLAHDPDLKRCFGVDAAIVNRDWSEVRDLRTLAPPHLPMPRLVDLLAYLAAAGGDDDDDDDDDDALASVWLILDIKVDNDPDEALRRIAQAVAAVPPRPGRPWRERVLLGVWHPSFLPPCRAYLPNFPLTHIGTNLHLAGKFLRRPHIAAMTIFVFSLLAPVVGPRFVRRAHAQGRSVFAWTVNDPRLMHWCVAHRLDGVITDDPTRFAAVRAACLAAGDGAGGENDNDDQEAARRAARDVSWGAWAFALWILAVAWLLSPPFLWNVRRAGRLRRERNRARPEPSVASPRGAGMVAAG